MSQATHYQRERAAQLLREVGERIDPHGWEDSYEQNIAAILDAFVAVVAAVDQLDADCQWKMHDAYEADYFETTCGGAFTFIDGTPTDNKMRFCCYCGKRLVVGAA